MKKIKRITKKKLKEPDEFISLVDQAAFFIGRRLKTIVAAAILLGIILVSFFLYQRWERGKEAEAQVKFRVAMDIYQTVNAPFREASTENLKDAAEKFNEITSKFAGTSAGRLSLLYKGNLQLRVADFEGAVKSYEEFLRKGEKERLYRLFALEGLGYAHEGRKDYERALQQYRKILDGADGFGSAGGYAGAGRCYERMGKSKEALESYKAYLKVSEKSSLTPTILRKISLLEQSSAQ
jgi:tetratricopeptide (TPR) repeat protein